MRIGAFSALAIPFFLNCSLGSAQEAEAGDDEVFTLSPFEVKLEDDEGWYAGSTLVGTRTNTDIKSIPISVDAMTVEFMEDLGIASLEEAGDYIGGVDTVPNSERRSDEDSTAFRGLSHGDRENAASSKNFFLWYPRSDSYNLARIDFNKGSNSLMFGNSSPGGQANTYTKQAQFRDFGAVTARIGTEDTYRFTLDLNRKITENFALRINAVKASDGDYIDFAKDQVEGYDIAGTYKPFENTKIRFEYENLNYHRTRGNSLVSVLQEAASGQGYFRGNRHYIDNTGQLVDEGSTRTWDLDESGVFVAGPNRASADNNGSSRDANGGWASLSQGQEVTIYAKDGTVLDVVGPLPDGLNASGIRDYTDRDIKNYSMWLEQKFGDLTMELAVNRQEQARNRRDNSFGGENYNAYGTAFRMTSDGKMTIGNEIDRKSFGNETNIVRLTGSYPLSIGDNFSQFLVANVEYLDDLAFSNRERLVNKAAALLDSSDPDPANWVYDTAKDLEGSDRIRTRVELDPDELVGAMRDPEFWAQFDVENLMALAENPENKKVFDPMWAKYTDALKPFWEKRYSRSWSLSTKGEYFGGKLHSLLGVRHDDFAAKRYQRPGYDLGLSSSARRAYLADTYGEEGEFGQDVDLGDPDQAPEQYAYVDGLDQSSTTSSLGLLYELTEDLNVYFNRSESFRWQAAKTYDNRDLGAQEGLSEEFGLKGDLFEGLFTFNAAVFDIQRDNVRIQLIDSDPSSEEMETIFNDISIVPVDGDPSTVNLVLADPISEGYFVAGRGNNNERRTIDGTNNVRGYELNLQMKRTFGLQARVAFAHLDHVLETANGEDYIARTAKARAAWNARQEYYAANPEITTINPVESPTLGDTYDEDELDTWISDAEKNANAIVKGPIPAYGSRGAPNTMSWVLDYQFNDSFVLPGMRVLLSGRYLDNYLMNTDDGFNFYGGSKHPVSLAFSYKTKMGAENNPVSFNLRFKNLFDFENDEIREYAGFVDEFNNDSPRFVHRNVEPMSADFTVTYKF